MCLLFVMSCLSFAAPRVMSAVCLSLFVLCCFCFAFVVCVSLCVVCVVCCLLVVRGVLFVVLCSLFVGVDCWLLFGGGL